MLEEAIIDFGNVKSIEDLPPVGLLSTDGEELHVRRYNLECGVPYFVVMKGDEEYEGQLNTDKFENITAEGLLVNAYPNVPKYSVPARQEVKKTIDIGMKKIRADYYIEKNQVDDGLLFLYKYSSNDRKQFEIMEKVQSILMKRFELYICSMDRESGNPDSLFCRSYLKFLYNQPLEVTENLIAEYRKRFNNLSENDKAYLYFKYTHPPYDGLAMTEDYIVKDRLREVQLEEMLEDTDFLADICSHQNQISFDFDVAGKLNGIKCKIKNNAFFNYLAEPGELSRVNKGLKQVSYPELSDPEIFSIINRGQGEEINYLPDSPEAQILTKAILGHDAEEITVNTKDMLKASFESILNEVDCNSMDLLVFL